MLCFLVKIALALSHAPPTQNVAPTKAIWLIVVE